MKYRSAYQKCIKQMREADAYFASLPPYEEPVIEEGNIDYPKLPNLDLSRIKKLRIER